MDFINELNNKIELINNELISYFKKDDCPEKILNQSMEYSLMAGGKRIRPILIISSYSLFNNNIEKCIQFAIAMEMVHTFSLIHDDLPGIDNDDFRRGNLTNHKKFNEATAILAGDSLLNKAYGIITKELIKSSGSEREKIIKSLEEFSYGIDRMIAGEYVDTEYEGKEIANKYLEYIHKNKTGALIVASIKIGAILGGANEIELDNLTNYAEKIGLGFQIKDDILSEIGDEKIMGKPVGNDKERGKCTYITKYGLEESIKMLNQITKEALSNLEIFGEKADFLRELALYIENRKK